MRSNSRFTSALLCCSFVLHGCATIVTGKDQDVTFQSEPEEATIKVGGTVIGKTPLTTKIPRRTNQSLTVEKEGYKTFTTQMSTTMNGWFLGNIILGGFIGTTTDAASGSIHEYSPNQYFASLVPEEAPYGLQNNRGGDIKRIMLAFGPEIRAELATRGGVHVNELLMALGVTVSDKDQAFAALRNLAAKTPDDLELAKKVIEVFEIPGVQPARVEAKTEQRSTPTKEESDADSARRLQTIQRVRP